jgi:ArsR family transcriptional regulator
MFVASRSLQGGQARAQLKALCNGERCVCDLTADLGLAQSKLSFHLKVLKEAGLLADRQEGRWVYYRLQPEPLAALQHWLAELSIFCKTPASRCS